MAPLRLGLFGGTFDPPHYGHLVVAQEAVERLCLDRLLFLVAGVPPHKVGEVSSSPGIRMEMTRAATMGNPLFRVSEVELNRDGPSYTVDTLRHFRAAHPDSQLHFLLGADQWVEFPEWQGPAEITELATLVVVARDGLDPAQMEPVRLDQEGPVEFVSLPVTRVDLSSSDIRSRVREGRSIRYMVPKEVRRIIETHGLYRSIS